LAVTQGNDLQEQARALGNRTRYRIYEHITEAEHPVGVSELTDLLELNHNAIRQHLAKLVRAGLLEQRTEEPKGPGRPRLTFTPTPTAQRRWGHDGPYRRLSLLLVDMLATGRTPIEVGRDAGHHLEIAGADQGDPIPRLGEAIARGGFDPQLRRRGSKVEFVLRTCPFAEAADVDPDTICDLHLGLAQGLADQLDHISVDELIRANPHRAGCRLRFHIE
jgi:predicted ArsR family transcriptional regulator